MKILNKGLADTLCTIVACGFIKRETDAKERGTSFIYENAKAAKEHTDIAKKLGGLVDGFTVSEQTPKVEQPFIMTKTGDVPEEIRDGAVDDLRDKVRIAEKSIHDLKNQKKDVNLPGAYIGGMNTVNKVTFCGGSDLYPYDPIYRNNEGGEDLSHNEIVQAYNRARDVSNILAHSLKSLSFQRGNVKWSTEEIPKVTRTCGCQQIFASVHGMTRSITHLYTDVSKQKIFLELALGEDTCKVASCIPCSIFMSANGMPATATHLGRGDNWNFPEDMRARLSGLSWEDWKKSMPPVSPDAMMKNWCLEVSECYKEGMRLLADNKKVKDWKDKCVEWEKKFTAPDSLSKRIPEIFLEALTYESSFVNKMNAVLV